MLNFSDMTAPVFKMISTERAFILEHITAVQKVLERLWGPLFPELPGLLNYVSTICLSRPPRDTANVDLVALLATFRLPLSSIVDARSLRPLHSSRPRGVR